ncbi:MAG: ABC transporter substrate-binding protein [Magnetospiraceae bacterium]
MLRWLSPTVFAGVVMVAAGPALAIDYMDSQPLTQIVDPTVQDCAGGKTLKVPVIAWGGDIATSLANGNARRTAPGSLFGKAGLDVELYRQDDFAAQVNDFLACRTPFLRGTMGMINMAAEAAAKDPRTALTVVAQLTWSAGGDALVVKEGIKTPADLKGKTIAVQAYGPHVDYLTRVLGDAGLNLSDVTIKWVKDLIEIDETSSSPAMAFLADSGVDAAFVIIPDALALTSGGTVGTGSEDSVRGARILLSTKTANRVIADVYAVRTDYFEANKAQVGTFVKGLLDGQKHLVDLVKNHAGKEAEYQDVMASAAELLLDSRSAVEDVAAMYGDAEFVGLPGNVKFFAEPGYPRNFAALTAEVQAAFSQLSLMGGTVPLAVGNWDYATFGPGGQPGTNLAETPRFDSTEVNKLVLKRQQQNALSEGELFNFEIYFAPNQNSFSSDEYQEAFDKAIALASTYGGALLTIEGHSDPLGYLRQKKGAANKLVLQQVKQAAKNLSFTRANAVKDSIIAYGASKGVTLDPSQFGIVGWGVMQPNTPKCTFDGQGDIDLSCAPATQAEWDATRRVVFRIIQIEAESAVFKPL